MTRMGIISELVTSLPRLSCSIRPYLSPKNVVNLLSEREVLLTQFPSRRDILWERLLCLDNSV